MYLFVIADLTRNLWLLPQSQWMAVMLEYACALVAQGIEHSSPKAGVVRSNRIEGTTSQFAALSYATQTSWIAPPASRLLVSPKIIRFAHSNFWGPHIHKPNS